MQTLSIFLLSIIINACSSPDDIPKAESNPFGYIEAGSTLNAYSKTVNDTIGIEVLLISQVFSDSRSYDLDNDGKDDINFLCIGGGSDENTWGMNTHITPLDSHEIVVTECNHPWNRDSLSPFSLTKGSDISSQSYFKQKSKSTYGFAFTDDGSNGSGNCWGNEDYKFIGIKIKKEDSYAYAWIKLAIKTEDKNLEIIIDSFGSRE